MKTTKYPRIFTAACWLFGAPLPDRRPASGSRRALETTARLLIAAVLCAAIGYLITGVAEASIDFVQGFNAGMNRSADIPPEASVNLPLGVLIGLSLMAMLLVQSRVLKSAIVYTGDRLNLERERASRQELESTLRLLKAQIEPHFLFNTLGAVQQMAEDKAPQAAALTSELITFLRASMTSLRADTIGLDEDCAICEAYLRIMQARLGQRLSFSIDYPMDLGAFALPTTLLLTLVENAVKHGIERAPAGGRIDISAQRQQDRVVVTVADTGAGFGATVGQGVGLQHIHDRLALIYNDGARLTIEENAPTGVVARLYFPYVE
ncbi:sensor histidine kinase [Duganella sp. HH105]|uniref:sensor histidine kinase n=1 Tax=Duganella sp. HH105 TaxID=1781067 RepID=UPI000877E252|nr:histidine kinase [Duganella sp. HH105]OEZ62054.1 sensor histidine kinase YehU [Duganella sp. HH105]